MSLPTYWPLTIEVAFAILSIIFLTILTAIAGWRNLHYRSLPYATALVLILFLCFKQGHTRYDGHIAVYAGCILSTATLCALILWKAFDREIWKAACIACFTVILLSACVSCQVFGSRKFAAEIAYALFDFPIQTIGAWINPDVADTRMQYQLSQDNLRQELPLPYIKGSADIYPCAQASLIAYGVDYKPRPVFQSYSAYTPGLAKMNADYLKRPDSPDYIFFDTASIDRRYPSLDDGYSWPLLLTRYDIEDTSWPFLVMHKARNPRSFTLQPIKEINCSMGKTIPLPSIDDGPIWVRITGIKLTKWGGIRSVAYKPPMIFMAVYRQGSRPWVFRIIPSMAEAGFLLSPFIWNKEQFTDLASKGWRSKLSGAEIKSILLYVDPKDDLTCYKPDFSIHLYRLRFPPQKQLDNR
jgi:hypothetical protein